MFRTFDYECSKCEDIFEIMTKVDETATCKCGNVNLKKTYEWAFI